MTLCDVLAREHADHPGSASAARRRRPRSRVGELRAHDGRVAGVRDGVEIVEEPALAAEQRLVLDAQERAPDPRLRGGLGSHAPLMSPRLLSPCGRAPRRSPRAPRGCSRRDDEPGRRARDPLGASVPGPRIRPCRRPSRATPGRARGRARRGKDAGGGRADLHRPPRGRRGKHPRDARRRGSAGGGARGRARGRGGRARAVHWLARPSPRRGGGS